MEQLLSQRDTENTGGETKDYIWKQTSEEIEIRFPLPPG